MIISSTILSKKPAPTVTPGSASWTTPGSYTFVVPQYNTIAIAVDGAGGGGNADNTDQCCVAFNEGLSQQAGTGGASEAAGAGMPTMIANGGGGGIMPFEPPPGACQG